MLWLWSTRNTRVLCYKVRDQLKCGENEEKEDGKGTEKLSMRGIYQLLLF